MSEEKSNIIEMLLPNNEILKLEEIFYIPLEEKTYSILRSLEDKMNIKKNTCLVFEEIKRDNNIEFKLVTDEEVANKIINLYREYLEKYNN